MISTCTRERDAMYRLGKFAYFDYRIVSALRGAIISHELGTGFDILNNV